MEKIIKQTLILLIIIKKYVVRVKVKSDEATEKSEQQKVYEAKLARWQKKKAN
jgi:hypothetical protein